MGGGHFLVGVARFFAAERPDWCFWFGSTHLLGPAVALGRLTGTRSLYGAQFDLDMRPRLALPGRPGLWRLYAWGLSQSSRIVLQHGGQYADVRPRWRSKTYVIPGVVNVPESFTPHAQRSPYVAWVGVLRRPKRPDLLIEIARACPDVRFVVCGGASAHRSPHGYSQQMIEELEQLPNIEYLGHVASPRALEIIGNAALLLSTSEAEGFPSVFVEAWAQGTPVVSLTIDPDQAIVRHGLGAVSRDVTTAARDVRALVGAPEIREAIGQRTRQHVVQTHSAAVIAERIAGALQSTPGPALQPLETEARS
jgi:glycosyltransferase involved in cell wall biosynthesis